MNTFQTIDISALNTITGGVVSGVNRVGVVGGVNNVVGAQVGSVDVNRNPVVGVSKVGSVVGSRVPVSSVGVV